MYFYIVGPVRRCGGRWGRNDMVGEVRIEFICHIIMCYNVLEDIMLVLSIGQ